MCQLHLLPVLLASWVPEGKSLTLDDAPVIHLAAPLASASTTQVKSNGVLPSTRRAYRVILYSILHLSSADCSRNRASSTTVSSAINLHTDQIQTMEFELK